MTLPMYMFKIYVPVTTVNDDDEDGDDVVDDDNCRPLRPSSSCRPSRSAGEATLRWFPGVSQGTGHISIIIVIVISISISEDTVTRLIIRIISPATVPGPELFFDWAFATPPFSSEFLNSGENPKTRPSSRLLMLITQYKY